MICGDYQSIHSTNQKKHTKKKHMVERGLASKITVFSTDRRALKRRRGIEKDLNLVDGAVGVGGKVFDLNNLEVAIIRFILMSLMMATLKSMIYKM